MEAIDAILAYGKYDEENDNDPIKVITLKKVSSKERKGSNVVARNVTGRYVYDNRKAFECIVSTVWLSRKRKVVIIK